MDKELIAKQEIEAAIRDYYDGWWASDTERIGRGMHEMLVKRNVGATAADSETLVQTSYRQMIGYTAERAGDTVPEQYRDYAITKLEYYQEIASVTVESGAYREYLHLARQHGHWRIVNVLWTYNRAFPKELRYDSE